MLLPVERANFDLAADVLTRGFPNRSRQFWLDGLDNLDRTGWNRAANVPFGHMLMDGSRPAGIYLLPAMMRTMPDGTTRRVINWSSWYIDPEFRWQSMPMLRAALGDKTAIYTDMTATHEVQKMLPALGFTRLNDGLLVHALPLLAVSDPKPAKILPFARVATDLPAHVREAFSAHSGLGVHECVLADADGLHPLMFKLRRYRGLPIAILVYCDDNARLGRNLGAVARHLLLQGRAALIVDRRPGLDTQGGRFSVRGIKFARGDTYVNRTDYLGSELCVFDV